MRHRHRLLCLLPILSLVFPLFCFAADEVTPYPGVIHIHSNISTGDYSLREITRRAQAKGVKVLVFTDSFLRRWEYPFPIFPNILKISTEEKSVSKYGIKRYLKDIDKIRAEFPGMIILAAVEVTPFYWWSGSIFKKNFSLNDGNKHLLVIGLKGPDDYAGLPVIGNRYFLPKLKDLPVLFFSLLLAFLGLFLLKKTNVNKTAGIILSAAGIFLFLQNFPFSASRYNYQHGFQKYLPYQELIDYVRKKDGLVFWAHPEVSDFWKIDRKFGGINLYSAAYPQALFSTVDYSGFGMGTGSSKNELILAGNLWDQVLLSYCQGKRGHPAWVIGELDYRHGEISALQNVFLLPEFRNDSVISVLKNGKLYLRFYVEGKIDISLEDFYIQDLQDSAVIANIADEVKIQGNPILHIKGTCRLSPEQDLRAQVIRDGRVAKEFEFNSAQNVFDLEFQDDSPLNFSGKSYYRLNIYCGNNVVLVTNPIFVVRQDE